MSPQLEALYLHLNETSLRPCERRVAICLMVHLVAHSKTDRSFIRLGRRANSLKLRVTTSRSIELVYPLSSRWGFGKQRIYVASRCCEAFRGCDFHEVPLGHARRTRKFSMLLNLVRSEAFMHYSIGPQSSSRITSTRLMEVSPDVLQVIPWKKKSTMSEGRLHYRQYLKPAGVISAEIYAPLCISHLLFLDIIPHTLPLITFIKVMIAR